MDEPLTEELLEELLNSPNPDSFFDRHRLEERRLSDYLNELLETHDLKRSDVIRRSGLDSTYGYQIFVGSKGHPSRDKVLAIALAMGLTIRECDRLLQAAGVSKLYCKDRRDAIIVFCIDRHASLDETNEALYTHGEAIIE